MATGTSDQLQHSDQHFHYTYNLRFNAAARKVEVVKLRKCPNKSSERLYKGTQHCLYVERFTGIRKRASDRKNERVGVQDVPLSILLSMEPEDLPRKHNNTYCRREMIERAFSTTVFSELNLIDMIDNLRISLAGLVADVEVTLLKEKDRLVNKRLVVNNEIPHTQWLYKYLSGALDDRLVVKSREENFKYSGLENLMPTELTEYAASEADLVIIPDKAITNDTTVCMVMLGLVAEVKEKDEGDFPISECYRNMSAVAASLVVQTLLQGTAVEKVSIYGIVAVVADIDASTLLKLQIDFKNDNIKFLKSIGTYKFDCRSE